MKLKTKFKVRKLSNTYKIVIDILELIYLNQQLLYMVK